MTEKQEDHSFCRKTTERSEQDRRELSNRLKRIEGQVRGLRSMVDRDAYCMDILMQVLATNAALNSFARELTSSHIRNCVVEDIARGDRETVDELVFMLQKLIR